MKLVVCSRSSKPAKLTKSDKKVLAKIQKELKDIGLKLAVKE